MPRQFASMFPRWLLLALLPLTLYGCGMNGGMKSGGNQKNLVIRPDYELAESVADMTRHADLVVVGRYVKLETSRRQMTAKASPGTEHLTYTFKVERVLKGSAEPEIRISLLYKVSPEGIRDKSGRPVLLNMRHPLFAEPVFGRRTILFLKKDLQPDVWSGAAEPFQIAVGPDGKAALQSNLLTGKAKSEIRLNDLLVVYDHSEPGYKDTVSGRNVDEIIREIERAAGKK